MNNTSHKRTNSSQINQNPQLQVSCKQPAMTFRNDRLRSIFLNNQQAHSSNQASVQISNQQKANNDGVMCHTTNHGQDYNQKEVIKNGSNHKRVKSINIQRQLRQNERSQQKQNKFQVHVPILHSSQNYKQIMMGDTLKSQTQESLQLNTLKATKYKIFQQNLDGKDSPNIRRKISNQLNNENLTFHQSKLHQRGRDSDLELVGVAQPDTKLYQTFTNQKSSSQQSNYPTNLLHHNSTQSTASMPFSHQSTFYSQINKNQYKQQNEMTKYETQNTANQEARQRIYSKTPILKNQFQLKKLSSENDNIAKTNQINIIQRAASNEPSHMPSQAQIELFTMDKIGLNRNNEKNQKMDKNAIIKNSSQQSEKQINEKKLEFKVIELIKQMEISKNNGQQNSFPLGNIDARLLNKIFAQILKSQTSPHENQFSFKNSQTPDSQQFYQTIDNRLQSSQRQRQQLEIQQPFLDPLHQRAASAYNQRKSSQFHFSALQQPTLIHKNSKQKILTQKVIEFLEKYRHAFSQQNQKTRGQVNFSSSPARPKSQMSNNNHHRRIFSMEEVDKIKIRNKDLFDSINLDQNNPKPQNQVLEQFNDYHSNIFPTQIQNTKINSTLKNSQNQTPQLLIKTNHQENKMMRKKREYITDKRINTGRASVENILDSHQSPFLQNKAEVNTSNLSKQKQQQQKQRFKLIFVDDGQINDKNLHNINMEGQNSQKIDKNVDSSNLITNINHRKEVLDFLEYQKRKQIKNLKQNTQNSNKINNQKQALNDLQSKYASQLLLVSPSLDIKSNHKNSNEIQDNNYLQTNDLVKRSLLKHNQENNLLNNSQEQHSFYSSSQYELSLVGLGLDPQNSNLAQQPSSKPQDPLNQQSNEVIMENPELNLLSNIKSFTISNNENGEKSVKNIQKGSGSSKNRANGSQFRIPNYIEEKGISIVRNSREIQTSFVQNQQ